MASTNAKHAIERLKFVKKEFSETIVAKPASGLERFLISADQKDPDNARSRAAMQRRVESFAQAVALYTAPSPAKRIPKRAAAKTKAVRAAKKTAKTGPLRYNTAVFKCLGDYDICCRNRDWRLCASFAAICIMKQLIPFVRHEGDSVK